MSSAVGRLCLCAALAAVTLLAVATGAGAASHPLLTVATVGTPFKPPAEGTFPFDDPCGLATDSEAHLYVSDYQRDAIDLYSVDFDLAGNLQVGYLTQIVEKDAPSSACELALDSAGNLFGNYFHQGARRYTPSSYPFPFGGLPSYSAPATIGSGAATGVAVDSADDTLYVARRDRIEAYSENPSPGDPPSQVIGLGSLGEAYGLAVSGFPATNGYLYVADAADNTVKVYDPAVDPIDPVEVIDGAGTPQGGFNDLADSDLAVSDSTGELFVLDNLQPGYEHPAAAVDSFDAAGTYLGQLPQAIVHGAPSGLAVDNSATSTRGLIYASSGNEEGGAVYAFCPTAPIGAALQTICPAPTPSALLEVSRQGSGAGTVASFNGGPIDCGVLCVGELDAGTTVTLIAAPKPHSAFSGWSVTGADPCPGIGSCKVMVTADTAVSADFTAIPQRTLTVSRTGSGAGRVASSPGGVECGSVCPAGFDQGTQLTLTAEAAPGSEFTGWSGGGCSGTGSCRVGLEADTTVTASFRELPRSTVISPSRRLSVLAISVGGAGAGTISSQPAAIECGTPCSNAYASGTAVTLTAAPDSESRFAGWSGCDGVNGNRCTLTLVASRTVGASFAEAPPKRCRKKQRKAKARCKGPHKGQGKGRHKR